MILSDNESVLQQIRRWIGEGCKATLANTSDADILREILTLLHSRIRAGSATFLVKVKSHRGEPLNERADMLAEQGRQRSENDKQWNARTERIVFSLGTRDDNISYTSVWTNRVRNTIRERASADKLRQVQSRAATVWMKQTQRDRRLYIDQECRHHKEAVKDGTFKQTNVWGRQCMQELESQGGASPATGTWCTNFISREGQTREQLGKWLTSKAVPEKRRRRMIQLVTGTFPCGANVHRRQPQPCELCKKVLESRGCHVPSRLPRETVSHIQSAGCIAQRDAVTKAHNDSIRSLMDDVIKHGKKDRALEFITVDAEQTLHTLWRNTKCVEICTEEELEQAMTQSEQPTDEQVEAGPDGEQIGGQDEDFWRRRPDSVVLDHDQKVCYLVEFKRTNDQWPTYRHRAEKRAQHQYNSLLRGLNIAGQRAGWSAQQIVFVGGIGGSVEKKAFDENMTKLQVSPGHWSRIRTRHAQKLLEVSERVLRSYYSRKYGKSQDVYVQNTNLGREQLGQDVYG